MNTIPSTFNEHQIQQTILGGTRPVPNVKLPLGVILLSTGNGGHYRGKLLEKLIQNGFSSIVCIEKSSENYNLEEYVKAYPCVRFIIPHEEVSVGDMINMGMSETSEDNVLVINDSIHVSFPILSNNIFEKYITGKNLCVAPRLLDMQRQFIPIRITPIVEDNTLKTVSSSSIAEKSPTLYPFDFIGIYNRQRFIRIGGFDSTIKTSYWQNLDFSVRAWLWGESIIIVPAFQLAYDDAVPVEDSTPDTSQLRFYLKNCAPKYSGEKSYIPISRFFNYMKKSGNGFSDAYKQFREARHWVEKNRYCFVQDVSTLINTWEVK